MQPVFQALEEERVKLVKKHSSSNDQTSVAEENSAAFRAEFDELLNAQSDVEVLELDPGLFETTEEALSVEDFFLLLDLGILDKDSPIE